MAAASASLERPSRPNRLVLSDRHLGRRDLDPVDGACRVGDDDAHPPGDRFVHRRTRRIGATDAQPGCALPAEHTDVGTAALRHDVPRCRIDFEMGGLRPPSANLNARRRLGVHCGGADPLRGVADHCGCDCARVRGAAAPWLGRRAGTARGEGPRAVAVVGHRRVPRQQQGHRRGVVRFERILRRRESCPRPSLARVDADLERTRRADRTGPAVDGGGVCAASRFRSVAEEAARERRRGSKSGSPRRARSGGIGRASVVRVSEGPPAPHPL